MPIFTKEKEGVEKIEKERAEFKELLIKNPNYFGTITEKEIAKKYKPASPMSNKIKYEELVCVGLYPEDNLLEAVIEIKQPYGYKGSLCTAGSKEYVAFYIDWNDGAGYVSAGAPAEVNVHDLSFVDGGHLFYAVRAGFLPKQYIECKTPQVVKVKAILSWEQVPTGPGFIPVWGNSLETWVQIRSKAKGPIVFPAFELKPVEIIKPLLEETKPPMGPIPPIEKFFIAGEKKEIKELIDKSIEAEEKIKKEGKVEEDRFEFKSLVMKNPNHFGSISDSKDKKEIMQAVYKLPLSNKEYLLSKLAANPDFLIPAKVFCKKTKYEELKCIGLYPEGDLLEAVIEVKLPYGFNGDLCTLGSKEYVAFYIDWNDGAGYQHAATSMVSVHDIPDVDGKHPFYAVKAKVSGIESKLKSCSIENIVKVKAILSWNLDPTPFGHTFCPTWGNILERDIQIRPSDGAKCEVQIVNNVHKEHISQSGIDEGLAVKIESTYPFIFDRPFGGVIAIWGNINIPGAYYYRFMYSDDNGASWLPVKDKRRAFNPWPWGLPYIERSPDSEGWFSKSEYDYDLSNYMITALVHWRSHGKNGDYIVKLEVADASKNILCQDEVALLLDNVGPELYEFSGTPAPLPAKGVAVKDKNGNYKKCETFIGDEPIKVYGNFRDDYFRKYSLKVFGGNIDASGHPIGSGNYDDPSSPCVDDTGIIGSINPGPGQEMATLDLCTVSQSPGKVKCAYGIWLYIWDRSIVGGVTGYEFDVSNHGRSAFVTFDWDPTGC